MSTPSSIEDSPKQEFYDIETQLLNSLNASTPYSAGSPDAQSISSEISRMTATPEPTPEKKPVKKRKSWGQELPTPTTNLPPRKRAKTEAEKEQRRIERVLRNRAAAQSSRERKRKEVEALEDEKNTLAVEVKTLREANQVLSTRVNQILAENEALQLQMKRMMEKWETTQHTIYQTDAMGSPIDSLLTPTSITHDTFSAASSDISTPPPSDGTLDPSHLSTPCKNVEEDPFSMTQHTAVMLCPSDLPCQLTGPSTQVHLILAILRLALFLVSAISQAPLETIVYLLTNPQIQASVLPRPSPLIHLLVSLTTTSSLVSRLGTLSPTCALPTDATSSVRWFETAAYEMGLSKWISNLDEEGKEGGDPAKVCRKFVMDLRGQTFGAKEAEGLIMARLAEVVRRNQGSGGGGGDGMDGGRDGFDFSTVLSFDRNRAGGLTV